MNAPGNSSLIKISRRIFLANAGMAACAMRAGALFAAPAATPLVVRTSLGALRGESNEGVHIFRGVPFAEPPVGELRFRPPLACQPWSLERDATQFPASAMQQGEAGVEHSEDCLYLNLWAPAGKGPFPVFVWIHGGGFTGGHAFEPLYDGAQFAREGIVCITVAYRLGVLGFLDLGPLLGPTYAGSANNGLRDVIAALTWVQAHVSDFGGDPTRVTVGGESAGAKLSDILMGVPSARSLFHQVISESGGAERVWSHENSAAVAEGFGQAWKKAGHTLPSLRTAPATLLIETQHDFIEDWPQHFPLRAEIDGVLLPSLPIATIAAGATRGKRLLLGTNRDESALFVGPHPANDARPADLGNLGVAKFAEVFRHYRDLYPQMSVDELRIRALTAEEYWIPSMRVVEAHLKGGGSAWVYRLDFAESSGRLRGYAYHSLDTGLVWDKPHTQVDNAAAERTLATQIHQAWVAFIKGGAPSSPGLPTWPQYRSDTRSTMILDMPSRVEQRPQESELRLWDGVL